MARKSTSSSAPASNGQPVLPAEGEDTLRQRDVKLKESQQSNDDLKPDTDDWDSADATHGLPMPCDASLYAGGSRALTAISEQAFFLGFLLATSLISLAWLLSVEPINPYWQLAAFMLNLSIFHFLEFETTARFNLPATRAASFLLFTNGQAYNFAYALAIVEIVVSGYVPSYQFAFVNEYTIGAGIALIVVGQLVRSTAMVQAGTNFNHTPANKKVAGHELVTKGIYGWLRHPSYFGFFWWAIGTQLLVGNKVCLVGYILVLWQFFKHRIVGTFPSSLLWLCLC